MDIDMKENEKIENYESTRGENIMSDKPCERRKRKRNMRDKVIIQKKREANMRENEERGHEKEKKTEKIIKKYKERETYERKCGKRN